MILYLAIKHLHMTCVALSGCLFLLRAFWTIRASLSDQLALKRSWVRILPHLIDTLLLISAMTLAIQSGQYPFQNDWLTAKVLALTAYIILGSIALKRAKTRSHRICSVVAASLVFAYIVMVAMTHQVLPWMQ